MHFGALLS